MIFTQSSLTQSAKIEKLRHEIASSFQWCSMRVIDTDEAKKHISVAKRKIAALEKTIRDIEGMET